MISYEQSPLLGGSSRSLPEEHSEYFCPITCALMLDPVVCADGTTYERSAISTWLANHNTSPLTGAVLPHKNLIPNLSLRALIEEFRLRNGEPVHPPAAPAASGRHPPGIQQTHTTTGDAHIPPVPQLTPEEARQSLLQHVGSGWTTDSAAATSCNISSCITVGTVVTKVLTFIETRTEILSTKPYTSGPISSRHDGMTPSLWAIECSAPRYFHDQEEKIEIPFTSYIETCSSCFGLGRMDCTTCRGSMRRVCPECNQGYKDNIRCAKCDGGGRIPCDTVGCDGGRVSCKDCQASGNVRFFKELVRKLKTINHAKCTGTTISDRDISSSTLCNTEGVSIYTDEGLRVYPPRDFNGETALNMLSVAEKSQESVENTLRQGGRVLQQKLTVQLVPITMVKAEYQNQQFHWYVYGTQKQIAVFNYPNKCCECCNRCSIS